MSSQPTTTTKSKPQQFIMNHDAPHFATRVLATMTAEALILSFGIEDPTDSAKIHVHTKVAMPASAVKSLKNMFVKMDSDIEIKKTVHGLQYSQIPSDS